jgi:hypothetical protein
LGKCHLSEIIEDKVSRYCNSNCGGIVEIDGPDKKSMLTLKLEVAVRALSVHLEQPKKQRPCLASGTP